MLQEVYYQIQASASFMHSLTFSGYGPVQSSRITDFSFERFALDLASVGTRTGLRAMAMTLVIAGLHRACRITSEPTNPVAPVTNNFMVMLILDNATRVLRD
jgi:hypothetical protein